MYHHASPCNTKQHCVTQVLQFNTKLHCQDEYHCVTQAPMRYTTQHCEAPSIIFQTACNSYRPGSLFYGHVPRVGEPMTFLVRRCTSMVKWCFSFSVLVSDELPPRF